MNDQPLPGVGGRVDLAVCQERGRVLPADRQQFQDGGPVQGAGGTYRLRVVLGAGEDHHPVVGVLVGLSEDGGA
ncbi:hypothetical protein FHR81_004680 [Actinoalloteichus hoggarensis]|uniref:hypothetical protein n=1 Tax=Actinoalloteichus hoggarensis TaxID=1470176 RepID=UPI0012FDF205|nr:hypothetical protein [Actinoalloteichus hoggarensis]MBB5923609.1 hypothetical protein [Actinoalloteichus hoggarensis]